MKRAGIYGLRNVVTGKWYVGQTVDLRQRKNAHFCFLRLGKHDNAGLLADFKQHGEASFEHHILEEVAEAVLDEREIHWIKYHGAMAPLGYNLADGGKDHKRHTLETRLKIAAARRGKPHPHKGHECTPLMKERIRASAHKISAALKGRPKPHLQGLPLKEETRRKISIANMGHVVSAETCRKMSVNRRKKRFERLNQNTDELPL